MTKFDEELEILCQELLTLMYTEDGVGLASPQVGVNKRIMVFNEKGKINKKTTEMILINPKIISQDEKEDLEEEGCLSFPMINGRVYRSISIEVEYQNLKGEILKTTFKDFAARIFQHEYDHLDQVFLSFLVCALN